MTENLYYEMHITIEFPGEAETAELRTWIMENLSWWHMGDLLMMKKDDERSHKDVFFTARECGEQINAWVTVRALCDVLKSKGYKVLRYKLEDTIVDSKINDEWSLLGLEADEIL